MLLTWAAISPFVLPRVREFANKRAEALASKGADAALLATYKHLTPDATLLAVNEAFFKRFCLELESSDLKTFTTEQTEDDLAKFLSNTAVQSIIQAPLDAHSPVDAGLLSSIWSEMRLIKLSEDFRWHIVAARHQEALLQQGLATGDLRPVFAKLTELAESVRQIHGVTPDFDTATYIERVNQDYGNLKLYQLHAHSADDVVRLRDVFVPQGVRESLPPSDLPDGHRNRLRRLEGDRDNMGRRREEAPEHLARYVSLPVRSVLEVASDPAAPRAVILGGPGSGKSSLLQYLALGGVASDQGVPLLIELGKYARDAAEPRTLLEFLGKGKFALFHLNQQAVDNALKEGRAYLLLDGLDEIFERSPQDAVIAEIKRLSRTYPKARILLTTRIVGYTPQPLTDAGFRHFTLQDFDAKQIDDFLDRWHRVIQLTEHERQSRHARLQKAVRDSPAIRELASNPLLLTMLALVNRSQEIPRERVKAYSIISEVLLHHWDFERGLMPDDPDLRPDAIGLEEKLAMARLVAFEMQQAQEGLAGNLIEKDRLEEILADYLRRIMAVTNSKNLARRIIERLRSRDAILSFAGGDSYRFVHRTFLEYFCASEFDRQAVKEDKGFDWLLQEAIQKHWHDDAWHEVVRLIAGLSGETKTARIVDFLLAQPTYRAYGSNVILAAQCLTELRQFTSLAQVAAVRQQLSQLYGFETVRDRFANPVRSDDPKREVEVRQKSVELQAALAESSAAGWKTLESLAATSREWDVRQAAVQELARGWSADPDTLRWLKSRAESDENWAVRQAAVQELARGWSADPDTLRILKSRAESDENWAVRQAAVQELARGWSADPDTLRWLKSRAESDENGAVRQAAVQELARDWSADPDTLRILKSRAESDQDEDVRQAAVRELARGWSADPDTLRILKSRAESDENGAVRQAAVRELARGWFADPDTLRWLKSRAESDENGAVRQAAVRELARGWFADPDTLRWLKSRAESDPDEDVRQAAVQELARGWSADPDTLRWLKSRAESDENGAVRQAAVQELARGWPADPDTLRWLKSRVESDENWAVRQAAVQELARGWSADPDTLRWLKSRAESDPDEDVRQAAVQELARGWSADPDTLRWLKSRAESDENGDVRQAAVQELARGWSADPDTLRWLKSRAESDENGAVRQAAVQELARGWSADPDTLRCLKSRAESDENWAVRRAAVQELARGWSADPDTLRFLKSRAESDENGAVRQAAVQELARGWSADPDTLRILKSRAESDQHWDVRQAAVQELARGWSADPDTLRWLKSRAESDENGAVRQAAVQELARGWSADPDTLRILKSRAESDPDEDVRRAAVQELARVIETE